MAPLLDKDCQLLAEHITSVPAGHLKGLSRQALIMTMATEVSSGLSADERGDYLKRVELAHDSKRKKQTRRSRTMMTIPKWQTLLMNLSSMR